MPIICHNYDLNLSLTWLADCLQMDSEVLILFAEILLKMSFISILLTCMYLVALYQKTDLNSIQVKLELNGSICNT